MGKRASHALHYLEFSSVNTAMSNLRVQNLVFANAANDANGLEIGKWFLLRHPIICFAVNTTAAVNAAKWLTAERAC